MKKSIRLRWFFKGTALVALLAVNGFAGAYREEKQVVSVPVTALWQQEDMDRGRIKGNDWEKEMALLDQVIADAPGEIADEAQEKKLALIECMQREKLAQEAIDRMGYEGTHAVCGRQALLVFAPHTVFADETSRLQLIDSVSMASGVSAAQVKIILAKK